MIIIQREKPVFIVLFLYFTIFYRSEIIYCLLCGWCCGFCRGSAITAAFPWAVVVVVGMMFRHSGTGWIQYWNHFCRFSCWGILWCQSRRRDSEQQHRLQQATTTLNMIYFYNCVYLELADIKYIYIFNGIL